MRNNARKTFIYLIALVAFIIIAGYAGLEARNYLSGPSIVIENPENGVTLREQFVEIRGRAEGASLLTINGAKVLADAEGNFKQELLLGLGYNVFEVKVLDRFNREEKKLLEVVYKPNPSGEQISLINK